VCPNVPLYPLSAAELSRDILLIGIAQGSLTLPRLLPLFVDPRRAFYFRNPSNFDGDDGPKPPAASLVRATGVRPNSPAKRSAARFRQ
jgi:hypothetical protein